MDKNLINYDKLMAETIIDLEDRYVCMYVREYVFMHNPNPNPCVCVSVFMNVYMYVCVCTYSFMYLHFSEWGNMLCTCS